MSIIKISINKASLKAFGGTTREVRKKLALHLGPRSLALGESASDNEVFHLDGKDSAEVKAWFEAIRDGKSPIPSLPALPESKSKRVEPTEEQLAEARAKLAAQREEEGKQFVRDALLNFGRKDLVEAAESASLEPPARRLEESAAPVGSRALAAVGEDQAASGRS